jgi:predicted dienelactone hydrolase
MIHKLKRFSMLGLGKISPNLSQKPLFRLGRLLLQPFVIALAWSWGIAPSLAAEQVTLRLGPLEQSIAIADLERFVETGELAPGLKFYAVVLTPNVRQTLSKGLPFDPSLASLAVDDLLQSPTGQRLWRVLSSVIQQDITPQQVQVALALAARQAEGLNMISLLKAFPEKTITVDVTSAVAVVSQLNLDYWESQTLSPRLEQDLAVTSTPVTSKLDPTKPGPEAVQTSTRTFWDKQRGRTIPVDLYWGANSQGPLVVLSHGFGGDRKFLAHLARHLASYGITVAALDHPGSNITWLLSQGAAPSPSLFKGKVLRYAEEFVERPKDVSFLLDELTKLNQQSGPLEGKLKTNQVSVIGHSLGGHTALALAGGELDLESLRTICQEQNPLGLSPAGWFQCGAVTLPDRQFSLRDPRVMQVIAINPIIGDLFGKKGLNQVKIPTLMVSGTKDAITPALANQLQPFAQLPQPKYLITAIGGTHLSVSDSIYLNRESTFANERLGQEAEPLRKLLRGVSLAFVGQLTPEAKSYEPFLTAAYAQSLSTSDFPLRLTTQLPDSIVRLFQ